MTITYNSIAYHVTTEEELLDLIFQLLTGQAA